MGSWHSLCYSNIDCEKRAKFAEEARTDNTEQTPRAEVAMSHTDNRTLINRGRKAGLRTTELYRALASRQREGVDPAGPRGDCNGYVPTYNQDGQCTYRPAGGSPSA
jgi:hypothetical protein